MEITFLGVVFAVIIVLLAIGRPLYQAIAGGMVVTAVLFHIPVTIIGTKIVSVITNWSSLSVLLSLYLITFLQKILESRSQIRLAQQDLNGIFHNRRINTAGAAFFIGLLPSAASMILCADIVKDATEGYLDPKEQAFTASWFRHIPESVLPTYTAVLLMSNLSGVEISEFIVYMIVPVIALAGLRLIMSISEVSIWDMDISFFTEFLANALSLVVGVEFVKMLCRHSAQTVVEVLMFATARQMVVEHMDPIQTLIGVLAIAILFAIRKFLMTEDTDMAHAPKKILKDKEEKKSCG